MRKTRNCTLPFLHLESPFPGSSDIIRRSKALSGREPAINSSYFLLSSCLTRLIYSLKLTPFRPPPPTFQTLSFHSPLATVTMYLVVMGIDDGGSDRDPLGKTVPCFAADLCTPPHDPGCLQAQRSHHSYFIRLHVRCSSAPGRQQANVWIIYIFTFSFRSSSVSHGKERQTEGERGRELRRLCLQSSSAFGLCWWVLITHNS